MALLKLHPFSKDKIMPCSLIKLHSVISNSTALMETCAVIYISFNKVLVSRIKAFNLMGSRKQDLSLAAPNVVTGVRQITSNMYCTSKSLKQYALYL